MKQLTCDLCGSSDLVKSEGIFVCQNCGSKYSVEEAKKMIVDGTVEVAGTVKVDSQEKLKNLYELAHRAKDRGDYIDALKYYDLILLEDATSLEAVLRSYLYGENSLNLDTFAKNLIQIFSILKRFNQSTDDQIRVLKEIYDELFRFLEVKTDSIFMVKKYHQVFKKAIKEEFDYSNSFNDVYLMVLKKELDYNIQVINKHNNEIKTGKENLIGKLIADIILPVVDEIKLYDDKYETPNEVYALQEIKDESESKNKSGGCYIATCVYGTYDCPELWILRRFRDYELVKTWQGRLFIRTYYEISPTLVEWFGQYKWIKKMWRVIINWMINNLKIKGLKDTPYTDLD